MTRDVTQLNVLSLFSGAGGFDLGLEQSGMKTAALCEIDANCRKVLRRQWSDVPIYEDVSELTATRILADGVRPDVVAFGSPCQDLSIAGRRAGLAGERSGLFGEAMRIVRELRKETNGLLPTFVIWENVVGAFTSSSGLDFAAVIDAMADAGSVVIEWSVLDAQHFGVPQRRRRIFVVSCFDTRSRDRYPEPLFPVRAFGDRDSSSREESGEGSSRSTSTSVGRSGARDNDGQQPVLIDRAAFNQGTNAKYDPYISDEPIAPSLVASGPHAVGQPTLAFDTQFGSNANVFADQSPTLKATQQPPSVLTTVTDSTAMLFDGTRTDDFRIYDDAAPTLKQRMGTGGGQVPNVVQSGDVTMTIRRLLPVETERLMGWPDDYTRWSYDGSEIADTHRYRMCGNGVVAPVAKWVGKQVLRAWQMMHEDS